MSVHQDSVLNLLLVITVMDKASREAGEGAASVESIFEAKRMNEKVKVTGRGTNNNV